MELTHCNPIKLYGLAVQGESMDLKWTDSLRGLMFPAFVNAEGCLEIQGRRLHFIHDSLPPGTKVEVCFSRSRIYCMVAADLAEDERLHEAGVQAASVIDRVRNNTKSG